MNNCTLLSDKKQGFFTLTQNASNDLIVSVHNVLNREKQAKIKRGKIREFTIKSQKNAKWTFRSFADQETCMVLTYPLNFLPNLDGRLIKKHLNTFLQKLRRDYPNLTYNWVLEFTCNSNPHFHLTTNIKPNDIGAFRSVVRQYWYDVVGTENPNHLKQGVNQCDYIKSKGGVATYIAGYLSKENQKKVPEQFKKDVGRFWGTSRDGRVQISNDYALPDSTFEEDKLRDFKRAVRPASQFRSKLYKKLTLESKNKSLFKVASWLICVRLISLSFPEWLQYLKVKLKNIKLRHYNTRRKAGNGIYWGNGQALVDKITESYYSKVYDDVVPF